MPYHIDFDNARRLARLTPVGINNRAESFAALRAVAADPRFGPDFCLLSDLRGSAYTPTFEDAQQFAYMMAGTLGHRRQALLVGGLLQRGVASQVAALANLHGADVAVFEDPAAAVAWLVAAPQS